MLIHNVSIRMKLIVGMAVPLILLMGIALLSTSIMNRLQEAKHWVDHTHNVIRQGNLILASAVDMETGARGFLLSGQDDFLEPYTRGSEQFDELVADLKVTVSDNPAQVELLGEIGSVIHEWRDDVVEPTLGLRREIGDSPTMDNMADLVGEARGKVFFDRFRGQVALFIDRERELMVGRQQAARVILEAQDGAKFGELSEAFRWVDHTYKVIDSAQKLLAHAVDMETGMRGYLLAGEDEFLEPYNSGSGAFVSLLDELKATVSDNPAQVTLLGEIGETIASWQEQVVVPTIALRREIGDSPTMNDMSSLVGEARGKAYFDRFRDQVATFVSREQELMTQRQDAAAAEASRARTLILGTAGIAILSVGCIVLLLIRGILSPINALWARMQDIAEGEGDLTKRIGSVRKDEVGRLATSFDQFVSRVHDVILEVRTAASEVSAGAAEISSSSIEIANGMDGQAMQIASVSAAVEEMSASISTVAQSSKDAASSSRRSGGVAVEGGEVVRETIGSMSSISEAVSTSSGSLRELGDRGSQIGEVTSVINEIAEQTNLLALNAAIEAARAGEHGRGFAVVADEVRKLADRTTEATEEINLSIRAIQEMTNQAVERMSYSENEVSSGMAKAEGAGEALENIVASSGEVQGMVDSIASAAEQQALVSEQVSSSMQSIAEVTTQATSSTQQSASASEQLSQRAQSLEMLVNQFRVEHSARA